MHCPFCRHTDSRVVDSRATDDGTAIRRRRQCPACGRRFTTVETASLAVTKRSGASEPFSRDKVLAGVRKACQGRPVTEDDLALLAQRVEEGTTVLLSSHILSEVERLADRVTIIRSGRAVETGTLAELRHLRRSRVVAEVAGEVPDLTRLAGVTDVRVEGSTVSCSVTPEAMTQVLAALTAAGVRTLTSAPPTLEELFLEAYRS